jgi:hypothetical protein
MWFAAPNIGRDPFDPEWGANVEVHTMRIHTKEEFNAIVGEGGALHQAYHGYVEIISFSAEELNAVLHSLLLFSKATDEHHSGWYDMAIKNFSGGKGWVRSMVDRQAVSSQVLRGHFGTGAIKDLDSMSLAIMYACDFLSQVATPNSY